VLSLPTLVMAPVMAVDAVVRATTFLSFSSFSRRSGA
jgi:hypothetical protein